MAVRLTGAFIEVHKVVDPDGTPAETKIAETFDDVTIGFNPSTEETTPHNKARTQTVVVGDNPQVTFTGHLMSDAQALQDLGIEDGSQEYKSNGVSLDAIRLKVYEKEGDASESQSWLLRDVVVAVNELQWPRGFAQWNANVHINGAVERETVA